MKKYLFLLALGMAGVAHAAPTAQELAVGCGIPAVNCTSSIVDNFGQTTPVPLKATTLSVSSTSSFAGDSSFTGTAGQRYPAASVITPSTSFPTPSAGNTLSARRTILAAGAPTAAFVALPAITANVGKTYEVYNQGSNPLAIVPSTGAINVDAALTPFSCTTLKVCQCSGLTTGVWGCSQQ